MCVYLESLCIHMHSYKYKHAHIQTHRHLLHSASKIKYKYRFPLCHPESYTKEHGGKCPLKKGK